MTSSPNYKTRVFAPEALRVIATVLVILIHAISTTEFTAIQSSSSDVSLHALGLISSSIAVPSFLFISGFFLWAKDWAGTSYQKFAKQRTKAILMPYLVWCLIYLAWAYIVSPNESVIAEHGLAALPFFILLGRVQFHFWFIPSFFLLTLLAPLFSKFTRQRPEVFFICATLLAGIVGNSIQKDLSSTDISIMARDFFLITLEFVPYVAMGAWYSIRKIRLKAPHAIFAMLAGGALSVLAPAIDNSLLYAFVQITSSVLLILGLITILESMKPKNTLNIIIQRLGKLTFEVYLSHILVMTVSWILLSKFGLLPGSLWAIELLLLFTATLMSFGLSYAIQKLTPHK